MPSKLENAGYFKGVLLAGGMSRRFGSDKALARVGEQTMLERQIKLLENLGLESVVITKPGRDYSFVRCRIAYDEIPDKGPLGGLYTACGIFGRAPLVVLTCDMPDLKEPLLRSLLSHHRPTSLATVFGSPKNLEPFPGIYESSLREKIGSHLASQTLSMHSLLASIKELNTIPCSDTASFSNINTPDELSQRALRRR